jgi:hypothetical protein
MTAIVFEQPLDVMIAEARFVKKAAPLIARDVEKIITELPDEECWRAAAVSYVAQLGKEIADPSLRATVKNAAIAQFARKGIA